MIVKSQLFNFFSIVLCVAKLCSCMLCPLLFNSLLDYSVGISMLAYSNYLFILFFQGMTLFAE